MSDFPISKPYANKASCRRAARKALGDAPFEFVQAGKGFAFRAVDAGPLDLPAFLPANPVVYDVPPGLKRLRASQAAESIRQATLADQNKGRKEAAARIAADAAAAAILPPAGSPADEEALANAPALAAPDATPEAGQAPEERKAAKAGRKVAAGSGDAGAMAGPAVASKPASARHSAAPKEGTAVRRIFDMLTRPEGATAKEMADAGLRGVSVWSYATDFAARFGLEATKAKDDGAVRVRLVSPSTLSV